jgi:hypothetical protein
MLKKTSGKAATIWTRGAYFQYRSTEKWRERRFAYPILNGGPFVFNIPSFPHNLDNEFSGSGAGVEINQDNLLPGA